MLGGRRLWDGVLAEELDRLRRHRASQWRLAAEMTAGGDRQIDLAAELAPLTVPTSAVFGLEDRITDWTGCTRLPTRVAIHLRAEAGHLPHLGAETLVAGLLVGPA